MTDYDLRTKQALRRVVLLEYGFGPETLRGRKVCPVCGKANSAGRTDCADCGCPRERRDGRRRYEPLSEAGAARNKAAPAEGGGLLFLPR